MVSFMVSKNPGSDIAEFSSLLFSKINKVLRVRTVILQESDYISSYFSQRCHSALQQSSAMPKERRGWLSMWTNCHLYLSYCEGSEFWKLASSHYPKKDHDWVLKCLIKEIFSEAIAKHNGSTTDSQYKPDRRQQSHSILTSSK